MLPDRTTTIGEDESVKTDKPFHSMKAVERTRAKLRIWAASCLGCMFAIEENMFAGCFELGRETKRFQLFKALTIAALFVVAGWMPLS